MASPPASTHLHDVLKGFERDLTKKYVLLRRSTVWGSIAFALVLLGFASGATYLAAARHSGEEIGRRIADFRASVEFGKIVQDIKDHHKAARESREGVENEHKKAKKIVETMPQLDKVPSLLAETRYFLYVVLARVADEHGKEGWDPLYGDIREKFRDAYDHMVKLRNDTNSQVGDAHETPGGAKP